MTLTRAHAGNIFFLPFEARMLELTDEQRCVFEGILAGFQGGVALQTVGGLAGTGKTVLVSELAEHMPDFAVATPTGKAAHVLREKGVDRAGTIHSLIYVAE